MDKTNRITVIKQTLTILLCVLLGVSSCKKKTTAPEETIPNSEVVPIDINTKGFDFLEKMQGHWIGKNQVLSWDWDWFAFDYRPISESHIFGIYEAGPAGNLFTSFFVTDYKDKRTIMARNGGLLGGIYRTSYFVLDSVKTNGNENYYKFVDAVGGMATMYMELVFKNDSLHWNVYTSRLGENKMPTRHMSFKAAKEHLSLASAAANAVGFPTKNSAWNFSGGFNKSWLYDADESTSTPRSATFVAELNNNDVYTLANQSGDPFTITDHPHLSTLQVNITRNPLITNKKLFLMLSKEPLTDNTGMLLDENAFNSVLLFPELGASDNDFLITYLHPGDYYITVIADVNANDIPSIGDVTHISIPITINVKSQQQITIDNITIQN